MTDLEEASSFNVSWHMAYVHMVSRVACVRACVYVGDLLEAFLNSPHITVETSRQLGTHLSVKTSHMLTTKNKRQTAGNRLRGVVLYSQFKGMCNLQ